MHDQGLYQILYALAIVTSDERYAAEADRILGWFLEQIALCEARIDDLLERDAKGKPGGFVDILGL